MANPLFNEQMQNGFKSQFSSFMNNPMQYLAQKSINIPNQYVNDPHGAVEYLLNNGKMSQEQLNSLIKKAQQMGFKI